MLPLTPPDHARGFRIAAVPPTQPLVWLKKGWADLVNNPLPGLSHGLLTAAVGAALVAWAHDRFWLLAGAFSGFLLVAPLVATGLYAVSRARERQQDASLAVALNAWKPKDSRLVRLGIADHGLRRGAGQQPGRLPAHRGAQRQQPRLRSLGGAG
jgi:hypothetical protein